ncbi:MAG: putative axonemal dynein intermediate chain 1 [Streblomastix strix]|uniref:Putative axonemal dynein intermediate chain 1 n=1 Tax=Streblomastix strix TaxID=222440 RepID=A0A5J4UIF0_9EUKA|nr:MAG: putative axonemal dynein intermediate chain 1 [Streblomastix strix]
MTQSQSRNRAIFASALDLTLVNTIKPDGQVQLTENELSEDERNYKMETNTSQVRTHLTMDSKCSQRDLLAESTSEDHIRTEEKVQVRNSFNITEVGTQTTTFAPKDKLVNTEPVEFQDFSATVTQWEIFDEFMSDLAKQKAEKELKKRPGLIKKIGIGTTATSGEGTTGLSQTIQAAGSQTSTTGSQSSAGVTASDNAEIVNAKLSQITQNIAFETDVDVLKKLKILERMTLQNTFEGISEDYKFWEDPSDQTKGEIGSLLPLWSFTPTQKDAKKKNATCIAWHPRYPDFFAVGYGSFDFDKQGGGALAIYTLKNHLHPEYFFTFEAGVMSIDWNKKHPPYLVLGLTNGVVCQLNLTIWFYCVLQNNQ